MYLFPKWSVAISPPCMVPHVTNPCDLQARAQGKWLERAVVTCHHPRGPLRGRSLLFCSTALWLLCAGSCWPADPGSWPCWDLGSGSKSLSGKKPLVLHVGKLWCLLQVLPSADPGTQHSSVKGKGFWEKRWSGRMSEADSSFQYNLYDREDRERQTRVCVVKGRQTHGGWNRWDTPIQWEVWLPWFCWFCLGFCLFVGVLFAACCCFGLVWFLADVSWVTETRADSRFLPRQWLRVGNHMRNTSNTGERLRIW